MTTSLGAGPRRPGERRSARAGCPGRDPTCAWSRCPCVPRRVPRGHPPRAPRGTGSRPTDLLEGDEPVEALLDDRLGDLIVHGGRGGAGSDGVLEGEGAREPGSANDVERALEVHLGLAREATMMSVVIAASGMCPRTFVDDPEEPGAAVGPAHVPGDLVGADCRGMQARHDVRGLGQGEDDILGEGGRVGTANRTRSRPSISPQARPPKARRSPNSTP